MNTAGIIGHSRQIRILDILRRNDDVPQTMLFSGKPGIGKKLIARRLLASLFCSAGDPPCMTCPSCLQAASGSFPDIIEIGPNEKGVIPIGSGERSEPGSVRWLIDRLSKKSIWGTFGVLIDGAETIGPGGQNALLKTIEEPQAGAHIILITANRSLILPTILSRCMNLPFSPLAPSEVREALAGSGTDAADPELAAELSGGSVETALLLADRSVLEGIEEICGEIASYLARGESLRLDLAPLQKQIGMDQILSILITMYRALMLSNITGTAPHPFIARFRPEEGEKLPKLIKILLAVRKGLANNLNIRNALKGMLYSMERMNSFGLPELDCTE
ncbi:MAG: AAA family ATPase [Spirochaetes bacterium]|nr:AAA family ATPase [Spirochaetota bacterium]